MTKSRAFLIFLIPASALLGGCESGEATSGFAEIKDLPLPTVTEGQSEAEFRYLSRLGSLEGPDLLEETPLDIVLDGLGRVVVTVATSTTPAVFDTLGNYLGRLGKVGEGPGEFRWPSEVEVTSDGSVLIYDSDLLRVNVFDSTLQFRESYPWEAPALHWLLLPDGLFVFNSGNPTREATPSLHLVEGGKTLISFGQPGTRSRHRIRRLALASSGGIWAAHSGLYRVDRWSVDGVLLDSIHFSKEWFTDSYGGNLGGPARPPRTVLRDIREDDEGRLWVVLWRPRDDWAMAWQNLRLRDGQTEVRGSDIPGYNELFYTQIDILDPEAKVLLATVKWNQIAYRFAGDGVLATLLQDESGAEYIDLWRVKLKR